MASFFSDHPDFFFADDLCPNRFSAAGVFHANPLTNLSIFKGIAYHIDADSTSGTADQNFMTFFHEEIRVKVSRH